MTLVTAMLTVMLGWAVVTATLVGIGLFVTGVPADRSRSNTVFAAFWTGLGLATGGLQLWHLVAPISASATVTLVTFGIVGLIWHRRDLAPRVGHLWRRWVPSPWSLVALAVVLILANRAVGPANMYDTRLYHLHVVEWLKAYAIVPGLGNLHDALAFNNANFLFTAAIDQGPFANRTSHIITSLMVLLWVLRSIGALRRIWTRTSTQPIGDSFDAVLLYPLTALFTSDAYNGLSTDVPVHLLVFFVTSTALRARFDGAGFDRRLMLVLALALSTAASIKLSAATFGLVIGIWLCVEAWRASAIRVRDLAIMTAAVAFIAVPWMARGIVLSGYPAYPLTIGGVSVEWRVPEEIARATLVSVGDHGRHGGTAQMFKDYSGQPWLKDWIYRSTQVYKSEIVLPALLLTIVAGILAWQLVRGRTSIRPSPALVFWLATAVPVVAWFISGPTPRYGSGTIWTSIAVAIVFAMARWSPTVKAERSMWVAWILFLCVALLARPPAVVTVDRQRIETLLLPAGLDRGFHPPVRDELKDFTTNSGLKLKIPAVPMFRVEFESGLAFDMTQGTCWPGLPAPLLRTPVANLALRLRDPRDVGRGFAIDLQPRPGAPAVR